MMEQLLHYFRSFLVIIVGIILIIIILILFHLFHILLFSGNISNSSSKLSNNYKMELLIWNEKENKNYFFNEYDKEKTETEICFNFTWMKVFERHEKKYKICTNDTFTII